MHTFDERSIPWQPFGDLPHFVFAIQHVDRAHRTADVLFKFAAGQQIVLHRHKALNHTFVVQGEHRLYEPDGRLREVEGEGVIGEQPVLNPGDSHEYSSFCDLDTDIGRMHGTYLMSRHNDGSLFEVAIPEFRMVAPFRMN